ncbi:MAG: histidine kinase [Cyanobacteria bacterium P01_A01_bin.123]
MTISCHILAEGSPIIIYASRNGSPQKVLRTLSRFLDTFAQERETAGEFVDTPECLVAQVIIRFGFEICEDDFSNLRAGLKYYPDVAYLYQINKAFHVTVWEPQAAYRQNPELGLSACQQCAIIADPAN